MEKLHKISDRKLIILDIAITFLIILGLLFLGWYEYKHAVSQTAYQSCVALDNLKSDLQKFIVVIPPPHETPEQKAYINNLISTSHQVFAQVKCSSH